MAAEPKPNAATETNVKSILRSIRLLPSVKIALRASRFQHPAEEKFHLTLGPRITSGLTSKQLVGGSRQKQPAPPMRASEDSSYGLQPQIGS
jgi:hypothetical protein